MTAVSLQMLPREGEQLPTPCRKRPGEIAKRWVLRGCIYRDGVRTELRKHLFLEERGGQPITGVGSEGGAFVYSTNWMNGVTLFYCQKHEWTARCVTAKGEGEKWGGVVMPLWRLSIHNFCFPPHHIIAKQETVKNYSFLPLGLLYTTQIPKGASCLDWKQKADDGEKLFLSSRNRDGPKKY